MAYQNLELCLFRKRKAGTMSWKKELEQLEHDKNWKAAIDLVKEVIKETPDDLDGYLSINYLLMNLLVEEDYERSKHDFYAGLLKKYFDDSNSKFFNNPEYLFYTGVTAYMSEWYFDIEIHEATKMLETAMSLSPENNLYKWGYYAFADMTNQQHKKQALKYAKEIIESGSYNLLKSKGALGRYILELMFNSVSKSVSE